LVVALAVVGSDRFASRVPDIRLSDITLLVDVPKVRIDEIEDIVSRRHPEATAGGADLTIDALGV